MPDCGSSEGPAKGEKTCATLAVRHHRRRDREGLRRRGVRAARRQGLSPLGGDRRRQPLRAPRRRARPRRARARHLGVLPAARDPDAAGEALERPVLAQPERRAPRDGVRDGDHAAGRGGALRVLRRGVPLARAPDVHRGLAEALVRARRPRTSQCSTSVFKALLAERNRRGAIDFETRRDAHGVRRARQDREHRARAAQRRAPPDRGMHAGGQRVRRQLPRRAASIRRSTACTTCRRPRRWPRCASSSPSSACTLPGGEIPRPKDYAQLLERIRKRPDFAPAADDPAALAQAGGVQPEQRRPLRPRLRRLRALHLADPALPGPARAPRDQGACLRASSMPGSRLGSARAALLGDRAARRRREPRRRELAQVLLHARPRRRHVLAAASPASCPSACS